MKLGSVSFAKFRLCHLLLVIVLALCFNQVSSTTNETDRLALLAFRVAITIDPFGMLNSWNDSIGFCQWYGVTCGHRHRRVTVLDLQSQGLSGSISPHIGNLSFLREMLLQNNSFTQEIPPQLGQLRRLRTLLLFNNSLVGKIPKNILGCSDLVNLNLRNNELTGEIPKELGSMPKLQVFDLGGNNLIGSVPSFIGNLSSLKLLFLSHNSLGGSIPQVLGHLTDLKFLAFGDNKLLGTIPSSLLNLSSLIVFDAGFNQIQGTLPASIGLKLPNLEFFSIFWNQFEGPIPPSISNCTKLGSLQLHGNRFFGNVPFMENLYKLNRFHIDGNQLGSGKPEDLSFLCSLTNSTKLQFVGGAVNNFGGVLPKCIGNLSITLLIFSFGENQISGEILEEFKNLIHVRLLIMGSNQLSGVIPSNLGTLQEVGMLYLGDNNLGGTIPSSFGNLTKLIELDLRGNNFHGQIPSHLSNCRSLDYLDLSNNNLSGAIPSQLIGLSSLAIILNLSHNHLTGVLPTEVGNLRALTALDVSNNLLVGEIPSSLGHCTAIALLRMGSNFFHGSIPQSIKLLGGIEELDLSSNNLSDAEMVAHVGDFGLAKFILGSSLDTVANQMSSVGLRGTIGYAPPEYAMGCEVSRDGDVYSYGILLLEMFTGLSPTDNMFKDNLTLHSFVAKALPGRVLEITDSILLQERESHLGPRSPQQCLLESDGIFQECLVMVFNIGVACSYSVPGRRMSISGIANQLQQVREKLFALGLHGEDELLTASV